MTLNKHKNEHFHFIGICGTAMGSVAAALQNRGYTITGSDQNVYPPMSDFLIKNNINVSVGHDEKNIPDKVDLVVIGNAMSRGNVEVESVLNRKIPYTSLPELIKRYFLQGKRNIVITGTHGKTTTSSIIAHLLNDNGLNPNLMIGGIPLDIGEGGRFTESEFFVIEGDEYDTAFFDKRSKFVHYMPEIVVVNNIEFDHADIFNNIEEIKLSFKRMLNIVPENGIVIVNGDDNDAVEVTENCRAPVIKVGANDDCDFKIENLNLESFNSSFSIKDNSYKLPMDGEFNVRNAAMAIAVSDFLNIDQQNIIESVSKFSGIARRQELRGEEKNVKVIDDFGHHPTAIAATIGALKQRYPDSKIWAIFEPRSNTSRRNLLQSELEDSLSQADGVIISEVPNPEKVPDGELLDVESVIENLSSRGKEAFIGLSSDDIVNKLIPLTSSGDTIVVLSNGGFGGIHEKLLEALKVK
ncbi:MAG: UDP-N-acetylmuramate:L-alanyl-gamma-D-glutamyl-meso-diaminopimelate ligase [Verrucomicrobiaceae bacterium]|nr:UDP-N-acetylmuramate:L-alanyl-gamma-D-glutamyl-meso-diaminopimelate ligase [Verrucomicrobiaceae bacterium]